MSELIMGPNDVAATLEGKMFAKRDIFWLDPELQAELKGIQDTREFRPVPLDAARMRVFITAAMLFHEEQQRQPNLFLCAGQISRLLGGFLRPSEIFEFLEGPEAKAFTEYRKYWPDEQERWRLTDEARAVFKSNLDPSSLMQNDANTNKDVRSEAS